MRGRIREIFLKLPRRAYHALRSLRLKNRKPTILTNNCVGGIIYHDLGLRFYSPTINLWMRDEDFLSFIEHLREYIAADVEEAFVEGIAYPAGRITISDGASILLLFMHYSSFQEARQKWNSRKQRINYDKLYVIMEYPGTEETEEQFLDTVRRFDRLPVRHKRLLTGRSPAHSPNAVVMDCYAEGGFVPGKILRYKTPCSLKRWLDDFDYIGFLNSGS